jgi:hypothetical protein
MQRERYSSAKSAACSALAALLAVAMAALPAQANQGGGGGGGGKADERATGTGSVATGLRAMYDKEFYRSLSEALRREARERRETIDELLDELEGRAGEVGFADDFLDDVEDDETTEDLLQTIDATLADISGLDLGKDASGVYTAEALEFIELLFELEAELAALRSLEVRQAALATEARALGAPID